jgi:hypothetical protein
MRHGPGVSEQLGKCVVMLRRVARIGCLDEFVALKFLRPDSAKIRSA